MAEVSTSSLTSDSNLDDVSTVISNALFYKMASKYKTQAQRNTILTLEFMYVVRNQGLVERYFGGSSAEGTAIMKSDVDKMIVDPNLTVCSNTDDIRAIPGHVFLCDQSGCLPGYVKLTPVKIEKNLKTIFMDHGKSIDDMFEKLDDKGSFLSSAKIVEFWINFLTKTNATPIHPEYRHGPSATATNEDIDGLISHVIGQQLEQDFAFAINFFGWPSAAEEWFRRKRHHHWPHSETIENISKMKFHVVPVGYKKSANFSIEWRISYLLAERELVWSFNDTQLQCYVLMKKILKTFIQPITSEDISSFHIKNIVFWESENSAPAAWQRRYLLRCVRSCLVRLKRCVNDTHLEHYIDRNKNLFFGKIEEPSIKMKVIQCLDDILSDIVPYVLDCIEGIDLLSTWTESGAEAREFVELCRQKKDSRITTCFDEFKSTVELYHLGAGAFSINAETSLQDFRTLSLYHEAYTERGPRDAIGLHFSENVRHFMNIRIAITLIKQQIALPISPERNRKLEILREMLEGNMNTDAISGRLYLATYWTRTGNYQETVRIIRRLLDSESKQLVYVGECSKAYSIIVSNKAAYQKKGLPSQIQADARYLSTVYDVMFSREDIDFVPYALKIECLVDRAFLLHPLVYLYYLANLSCIKMNDTKSATIYMDALTQAVEQCEGSAFHFRQLNILGQSYFLVGNFEKAFQCYRNSLKQTLSTKISNASIIHITIMIFQLIRQGYQGDVQYLYRRNETN